MVFRPNKSVGSVGPINEESSNPSSPSCNKAHFNLSVPCKEEVVYELPSSCGSVYLSQTVRCLNDRFIELLWAPLSLVTWQSIVLQIFTAHAF